MRTGNEHDSKPGRIPPVLQLHWKVVETIFQTVGDIHAESGGSMGGHGRGAEVSHFHFDGNSRHSTVTYSPDHEHLNVLFKSEWNPQGIRLRGFVHSHPGRMSRPSHGDEVYAERILKAIDDLDCLWLPIVNTVPDTGVFRLTPWAAYRAENGVRVVRGSVQITHMPDQDSPEAADSPLSQLRQRCPDRETSCVFDDIVVGKEARRPDRWRGARARMDQRTNANTTATRPAIYLAPDSQPTTEQGAAMDAHLEGPGRPEAVPSAFPMGDTFDRVRDAYDLGRMRASRLIAVGAGGAAEWLESMARAGVGQFVLIDPDIVSETNLSTQQTYRKDIGRPKVDCIAERVQDINPTASTIVIQQTLDDLSDEEVGRLVVDRIDGRTAGRAILCGLTDSFFAQARVNRLALHLGVPSLCAQVYKEGRGAEITFTYPGVTPACHRCILSSRYRHFLEDGSKNEVTSHGTPIFATARVNAIKGFVTLAILHHGSSHSRWGAMLSRIGKRNLVQLRMDPDLAETLGLRVFDQVFEGADRDRLFFDEVVWLPQLQECPDTGYTPCPDCGGTGDLRDSIGRFQDTRLPPGVATVTPNERTVAQSPPNRRLGHGSRGGG